MISIICKDDEMVQTTQEVAYYIDDVKNAIYEMFPKTTPVVLKHVKADYLKIVVYLLEMAIHGSSTIALPPYATKRPNLPPNRLHITLLSTVPDLLRYLGTFAESAKHFHVDIDWQRQWFTVEVRRKERTADN